MRNNMLIKQLSVEYKEEQVCCLDKKHTPIQIFLLKCSVFKRVVELEIYFLRRKKSRTSVRSKLSLQSKKKRISHSNVQKNFMIFFLPKNCAFEVLTLDTI